MKKIMFFVWIFSLLFITSWYGYSRDSEKTIGPITISQSIVELAYPADSFTITLSAPPSDETHRVYLNLYDIDWIDGNTSFPVDGGEVLEVDLKAYWPYLAPGETRQTYIIVKVQPDGSSLEEITDEEGISVSGEKPAYPDQHKLTLIRDGYPMIVVSATPLSPAGPTIRTMRTTDLYFDTGTVVELNAAQPVPTPCGTGCAQVTYGGMSGDVVITNLYAGIGEVTMDADKEITIVYYLSEAGPTISPTLAPTMNPGSELGDVNSDNSIDIVDALLVAQYYVGLTASITIETADVNCNNSIDIVDALLIAQYYVGLIEGFCL